MSDKNFSAYDDLESILTPFANEIKANREFVGTKAEWDALTSEQKARYVLVDITDDAEIGGYEDFTSQITKGDKVTTLDVTGFRDGHTVTILGTWEGAFTSTNDTVLFFPKKYAPKRQIRGCGTVQGSDNLTYNGYYWSSAETYRIGQSATATAKSGTFIISWPID